ncbi:MAG: hypothetical protein IT332_08755 [Ardenticatenales bacterium]|nr:hypothetical protein [Ardenticatenales bacterium]
MIRSVVVRSSAHGRRAATPWRARNRQRAVAALRACAGAAIIAAFALHPTRRSETANAQASANDVVTVERGGFQHVLDVAAAGPDDVWAVGWDGIVHFDGASWRLVHGRDGDGYGYAAVDVAADGHGWAVGAGADCRVAELRTEGVTSQPLAFACTLSDVSITPGRTVWIAGHEPTADGETRSLVAVRDGDGWRRVDHPTGYFVTALWLRTEADGWAAVTGSDGARLLRWDGAAWRAVPAPGFNGGIRDFHGIAADDVWAVGGALGWMDVPSVRTILHFDGTAWRVAVDDSQGELRAVEVRAADDVFASGQLGVAHFDGRGWQWTQPDVYVSVDNPFGLGALALTSEGALWAVGPDNVLRQDGSGWYRWGGTRSGDYTPLRAAVAPNGRGLAVGVGGPVVARDDDGRWREIEGPAEADRLDGVTAVGGDVWWATLTERDSGGQGRVGRYRTTTALRYAAGTWTAFDLPTERRIAAIAGMAPESVFALATERTEERAGDPPATDVLRFDGERWQPMTTLPDAARLLSAVDAHTAWAVGSDAWRLEAGTWRSAGLPAGLRGQISDIAFDGRDHGWLVGQGIVFERSDGRWIDRTAGLAGLPHQTDLWDVAIAPDGSPWAIGWQLRYADSGALFHLSAGRWRRVGLGPVADVVGSGGFGLRIEGRPDRYDVWLSGPSETIARVTHRRDAGPPANDGRLFLPYLPHSPISAR